jgi:hypothetical protein
MVWRRAIRFWLYAIVACFAVAVVITVGRMFFVQIGAPKRSAQHSMRAAWIVPASSVLHRRLAREVSGEPS